jgi:hypothetical protein
LTVSIHGGGGGLVLILRANTVRAANSVRR